VLPEFPALLVVYSRRSRALASYGQRELRIARKHYKNSSRRAARIQMRSRIFS
jgi:hypothetical protein